MSQAQEQTSMTIDLEDVQDVIFLRALELCRLAKKARLGVTQGRVIDAFRSLRAVHWLNEDDFRLALRTNLTGSREEELVFDRIFATYWRGVTANESAGPQVRPRPELIRGEFDQGSPEAHQELLGRPHSFSGEEEVRALNLIARWDEDALPVEQIVRALAKRLATRPSRCLQPASQGRRVDLRRSLRRSIRHGMDIVELARAQRRVRKTRMVMLCDVSGSMDAFNPFLLRLMFGLQKELKNSRTVVFSTRMTEITSFLRRRSVQQALHEIGERVLHWSGGTDIGGALAALNRGVLREGSTRSTVAIIISDGYDTGDTAVIEREMRALR